MTVYRYIALGPDGKRKLGKVEAPGEAQAKLLITSTGDLVIDVKEASTRNAFAFERRSTPKSYDVAIFASELSNLLKAGAPIRKALDIQSNGKGASAALASSIRTVVDGGGSLSDGLRTAGGPAVLLAEFASAGEAGAGIEHLLDTGGRFLNSRHEALSKLRAALAYPLFISLLALLALGVITLYVAPALAPMLRDAGQSGLILILSDIGSWTKENAQLLLLAAAGFICVVFLMCQRKTVQQRLNRLVWSMPILGPVAKDLDTGQSCEVLSALLQTGRPLESSLRFAAAVSGPQLASTYKSISQRLRDGEVASAAFAAEVDLPLEVRRLALLGERSSAFASAMEQAGKICHDRAIRRIDRLAAIAGPVLVIGMGVAIAALMLSVLGSLSSLGDVS